MQKKYGKVDLMVQFRNKILYTLKKCEEKNIYYYHHPSMNQSNPYLTLPILRNQENIFYKVKVSLILKFPFTRILVH